MAHRGPGDRGLQQDGQRNGRGRGPPALSAVAVGPPRSSEAGGVFECVAALDVDGEACELFWRVKGARAEAAIEAFLPCALLLAMYRELPLLLEVPFSARLASSLPLLMDIYTNWSPRLHRVGVTAPPAAPDAAAPSPGVGSFFSGGVDGFHTLDKHRDEITHLVLLHGFDYPLAASGLCQEVSERVQAAAARVGKTLVEIETNFEEIVAPCRLSRQMAPMQFALGAGLASAAALLAPTIGRVYVPSSSSYRDLRPFGSHPLIDRLWSLESLEIEHDGAEATRFEKVQAIAGWDVAQETLRVCARNPGGAYNCCRCLKCTLTMFLIHATGELPRFSTFPLPLDEALRGRRVIKPHVDLAPAHWLDSVEQAIRHLALDDGEARRLRRAVEAKTFFGRRYRREAGRALDVALRSLVRRGP